MRPMRLLTSLPPLTVAAIALCSGCAARAAKPAACEPVPAEFALAGQTVYRDCDVDRKARSLGTMARLPYTAASGQTCGRVVVDVVVDSTGRFVQETARVARSTDPSFALAALSTLDAARYEPALKDGRPVPQLVRLEWTYGVTRVSVPAGMTPASARPPRTPLTC
ncbi:MAG: energy transducer TonB [Gemmatimonadaceae bacterium]